MDKLCVDDKKICEFFLSKIVCMKKKKKFVWIYNFFGDINSYRIRINRIIFLGVEMCLYVI